MSNITPFSFDGLEVRVLVDLTGKNWFCLVDVSAVLGLQNSRDLLKRLKMDGVDSIYVIDSLGREQSTTFIDEPNLYRVIFQSRKENAVKFQDWVFEEVLPAIRKTGKYEVQPQPAPLQLPPADVRVSNLVGSLEKLGIDLSNPRFKQELQDLSLDILLGDRKRLPGSVEVWLGVAEKAEKMGYPVGIVSKNRTSLGRFVATAGLQSKKEDRLCNGTQRPINVYLDSLELEKAVSEFMDAKVLAS